MTHYTGYSTALNVLILTTGVTLGPPANGPYPGVYCSVYLANSAVLASIYAPSTGDVMRNPFLVNADGSYAFDGLDASYTVVFSVTLPASTTPREVRVPSFAYASLPTPAAAGRLARLTDSDRSLWMDDGLQWASLKSRVYDVRDFGAIGDGVTNDTAAIQLALTACLTAGGGTVVLPAGTYLISTTLTIDAKTTLRGVGRASLIKATSDAGFTGIAAETLGAPFSTTVSALVYVRKDATDVVIRDLAVYGSHVTPDAGSIVHNILLGRSTANCTVTNTWSAQAGWSGICTRGAGHLIAGNVTSGNCIDGIESWGSHTRITDNVCIGDGLGTTPGTAGIEVLSVDNPTTVSDIQVIGNHCYDCRNGIVSAGGTVAGLVVTGNEVQNTLERGMVFGGGTLSDLVVSGNLVRGTRGNGALGYGITVTTGTVRFSVTGNTVYNCNVGTGPSGIQVETTAALGTVAGNTVSLCWVGIGVTGTGTDINVIGNTSRGNAGANYFISNANASNWLNLDGSPRPTVTGSRGGNAALASALTALSTLGLITDSSS